MPPTTDGSSEEQEALYNMPAAPLWPMALMLLGGVGFLGTAVWYLLRR